MLQSAVVGTDLRLGIWFPEDGFDGFHSEYGWSSQTPLDFRIRSQPSIQSSWEVCSVFRDRWVVAVVSQIGCWRLDLA